MLNHSVFLACCLDPMVLSVMSIAGNIGVRSPKPLLFDLNSKKIIKPNSFNFYRSMIIFPGIEIFCGRQRPSSLSVIELVLLTYFNLVKFLDDSN